MNSMSANFSMFSAFLALIGLSLFHSVSSQFSPGFPYGSQMVRGVNLGGWLLLEVCAVTADDGQRSQLILIVFGRSHGSPPVYSTTQEILILSMNGHLDNTMTVPLRQPYYRTTGTPGLRKMILQISLLPGTRLVLQAYIP